MIANHLQALDAALDDHSQVRAAVVYGGRQESWPADMTRRLQNVEASLHELPGIDYDERVPSCPADLADRLQDLLSRIDFSPESTVVHAHNYALGKNAALPGALIRLATAGYPLLLQIHDFAEDFRPANYKHLVARLTPDDPGRLPSLIYPQAMHIHYAVLNRRDWRLLRTAGFDPKRVHQLPNPVLEVQPLPQRDAARRMLAERFGIGVEDQLILSPVRCIRRKNLGEALLWSSCLGPGAKLGFTLAPINPLERPRYRAWKRLAESLGLPCLFEVGATGGLEFQESLSAADLIITTSIAEGFGMVFLESWLAGRPLIGRDLPEITVDFAEAGLRLEHLHPRLAIPLGWVGFETFRERVEASYRTVLAVYEQPQPSSKRLMADIEQLVEDDAVDFAALDVRLQQQVVRLVAGDAGRRGALLARNPWVGKALSVDVSTEGEAIEHNRSVIREDYSLAALGERLVRLYAEVRRFPRDEPVQPPSNVESILQAFLSLGRFHPLRTDVS